MNRQKKNAAQQRQNSRELIDIQKITEYGLLTSHGAVSYTHLDVYKRQIQSSGSLTCWEKSR